MVKYWQLTGYLAATVVSLVCLTLVILYGLSFGPNKNILWIVAFIIAVLKRHLVFDVLCAGIYSLKEALITKSPPPDPVFIRNRPPETQVELDMLKRRIDLLMKKFWYDYYMDEDEDKATILEREKANIYYNNILYDLFMFSFYMMALLLIVLGSRDNLSYYSTVNVKEFLTSYKFGPGVRFVYEDVGLYRFINLTLLENTHRPREFNGEFISNEYGWVSGRIGKILGVIQLRQHRIPPNNGKCSSLQKGCVGIFNPYYRDTNDYSQEWKSKVNFTYQKEFWRIWDPWMYKNALESRTMPKFGDIALYPGGGYFAYLGRNYNNSQRVLDYLIRSNWLDKRTAVIFIEFTLYNVDANLFNIVTIIGERSPQGLYKILYNVQSLKLLLVIENLPWQTKLIFILFIMLTAVFLYRLLVAIFNSKFKSFISKPWNIVDTTIVLISVTTVVLFFKRNDYVGTLIDELEHSKKNEFVSFQFAALFDSFLTWVSAFLVVLSTMRIWKILNFAKIFRILTKTFANAASTLATICLFTILFLIGFATCITTINGGYVMTFQNFFKTLNALIVYTFGFGGEEISSTDFFFGGKILGILLYVILICVLCTLVLNIFVTILTCYFSAVREEAEVAEEKRLSFWQFIKQEIRSNFSTKKMFSKFPKSSGGSLRLRGGGNGTDKSSSGETTAKNSGEYTEAKAKLVNEIINAQFDYLDKYLQEEVRLSGGGTETEAEGSHSSALENTKASETIPKKSDSSKKETMDVDKHKRRNMKRPSSDVLIRTA